MTGSFVRHDWFVCFANFYTALREPQGLPFESLRNRPSRASGTALHGAIVIKKWQMFFWDACVLQEKAPQKEKEARAGKGHLLCCRHGRRTFLSGARGLCTKARSLRLHRPRASCGQLSLGCGGIRLSGFLFPLQ